MVLYGLVSTIRTYNFPEAGYILKGPYNFVHIVEIQELDL